MNDATRPWTRYLRELRDWARLSQQQAVVLLTIAVLAGLTSAAVLFIRGRRYEVRLTVTATGAPRLLGGLNAASVLSGLTPPSGFQSSPLIVAQLMQLDGLLAEVGRTPLAPAAGSIGEALLSSSGPPTRYALLRKLRRVVYVQTDRMSGLITVTIAHRDSALVQALSGALLERTRLRFAEVMRSQAQEARLALMARVDSAKRQLLVREEALRRNSSASRSVTDYSAASLNVNRLRREMELADAVYRQAVLDYEAAIARELEAAPALVVVDGSPSAILRIRPGALRCLVLGLGACGGTLLVILLLRRSLQEERGAARA